MLYYYGTDLLNKLDTYYGARFSEARKRGFDSPDAGYHWLYQELDLRVKTLRQTRIFIETMPKYLPSCSADDALRYAMNFSHPWFSPKHLGSLPKDSEGYCIYFTDRNPYWRSYKEVVNVIDYELDFTMPPMVHLVLSEYIVRCLSLYFFLRDRQFRPIDRKKFDSLMAPDDRLDSSA